MVAPSAFQWQISPPSRAATFKSTPLALLEGAQVPHIAEGTLRENVIFGCAFDEAGVIVWRRVVLFVCLFVCLCVCVFLFGGAVGGVTHFLTGSLWFIAHGGGCTCGCAYASALVGQAVLSPALGDSASTCDLGRQRLGDCGRSSISTKLGPTKRTQHAVFLLVTYKSRITVSPRFFW